MKILLDKQTNINTEDASLALYVAFKISQIDIVKIILEKKADIVNYKRDTEALSLYVACFQGHSDIVKILLDKEADINKCIMKDGKPPLYIT